MSSVNDQAELLLSTNGRYYHAFAAEFSRSVLVDARLRAPWKLAVARLAARRGDSTPRALPRPANCTIFNITARRKAKLLDLQAWLEGDSTVELGLCAPAPDSNAVAVGAETTKPKLQRMIPAPSMWHNELLRCLGGDQVLGLKRITVPALRAAVRASARHACFTASVPHREPVCS